MNKDSQKNPIVETPVTRQKFSGKVVSDKMTNTAVVLVEHLEKHAKYQKYIQMRKRFKVHNEGNKAKTGDTVTIEATRPISRHKHFTIVEITHTAPVELIDLTDITPKETEA